MRIIIHFLFLALVCTQELVDYDTYAEYHNQYKTILNWSFDKHPEEVYPSLLQMVDSLNLPDSIVVKSNFVDFFMKNPRFFKKPGVYLSFEENITFF